MNRRNFLRLVSMTCGALVLNPIGTINSFTIEAQVIPTWKDKILKLYPEGESPLSRMIKENKGNVVADLEFSWWNN